MQDRHEENCSLQGRPGFSLTAGGPCWRGEQETGWWRVTGKCCFLSQWHSQDCLLLTVNSLKYYPRKCMEKSEISSPPPKKGEFDLVLRAHVEEKERFLWDQKTALDLMWLWRVGDLKFSFFSALGGDLTAWFKIMANQSHTIKLPCTVQKIKG